MSRLIVAELLRQKEYLFTLILKLLINNHCAKYKKKKLKQACASIQKIQTFRCLLNTFLNVFFLLVPTDQSCHVQLAPISQFEDLTKCVFAIHARDKRQLVIDTSVFGVWSYGNYPELRKYQFFVLVQRQVNLWTNRRHSDRRTDGRTDGWT